MQLYEPEHEVVIVPKQFVFLFSALLAAGCYRTPGIDQSISMGNGTAVRCLAASRLSSLPGKKFQLQKESREFEDSDPGQFHFIQLTVEIKRSGTHPFDPATITLDGACNKDRTPATVTTYEIKPEMVLTYVIFASHEGPFQMVLPDGQVVPLARLLKK